MSQRSFPNTYTDPLLPWLPEIHTEQSQKGRQYCSVKSTNGIAVEIETVCHLSCGKKADWSRTEAVMDEMSNTGVIAHVCSNLPHYFVINTMSTVF